MNKYDQAIEFLKDHAPGSYYDECAALMEELLAEIEASSNKLAQFLEEERPARHKAAMAERRAQSFGAEAWYRRNGQRRSSAILEAE